MTEQNLSECAAPTAENPPTPQAESPEPTVGAFEKPTVPMDPEAWNLTIKVMGGTTTTKFDNDLAQKRADANERRKQYDQETAIGRTPIEQGGGMVFDHKFTDPLMSPKVKLEYRGRTKDMIFEMLCELVVDEVTDAHTLIFVCPECVKRGVDQQFAQVHANNKNRAWHLDKKNAGTPRRAEDSGPDGKARYAIYTHAGDIMDTDEMRCPHPNCGCVYKIHKNILYRIK